MAKDVIISVVGVQTHDAQPDHIEMVVTGSYYEKNGKQYITYKETQMTDMENTTTTIKVEPHKVSVTRFGQLHSNMVFELHRKHTAYYDTPHGCFTVAVTANDMNLGLVDGEGEVYVSYHLEFDHVSMGTNSFHILVRSNTEYKKMISNKDVVEEIQVQ